jgi:hypothetical protein
MSQSEILEKRNESIVTYNKLVIEAREKEAELMMLLEQKKKRDATITAAKKMFKNDKDGTVNKHLAEHVQQAQKTLFTVITGIKARGYMLDEDNLPKPDTAIEGAAENTTKLSGAAANPTKDDGEY